MLLILAGVTISSIVGRNSIVEQANDARNKTQTASIIEMAQNDILAKQAENEKDDITPSELKEILSKYFDTTDVSDIDLKSSDFELSTKDGKYKVTVGQIYNGSFAKPYPPYYSVSATPTNPDEFLTENNDDGTITITGFKDEYVSKYYRILGTDDYADVLVIPYKINNSLVTRVDWNQILKNYYNNPLSLNGVKKLILPNTIVSYSYNSEGDISGFHAVAKEVVLSDSLTTIEDSCFFDSYDLENIIIPQSVTIIGKNAFLGCSKLTINYKGTQQQWDSITKGNQAIPSNVKIVYDYGK